MNPSTDQVLTNLPRGFGERARWVSRSAMWMPLTPARGISRPQSSRVRGSIVRDAEVAGDVEQGLLDHPRHHARIGAAAGHRRDAARAAAAQVEHAFAQRVVRSRRRRQRRVDVETRPGLDHGVDVERADLLGRSPSMSTDEVSTDRLTIMPRPGPR